MADAVAVLLYLAASGALSLALLALVWLADRYEREPPLLVLGAALWGTLPAFLMACVVEMVVQTPASALLGSPRAGQTFVALLVAPPVEEAAKALAILAVFLFVRKEFDDVMDGLVYGAAVGIGFSFVEDFVYFVGTVGRDGPGAGLVVFLMRNVAFVLNHSLFTALTGIGFGLARLYHRRRLALVGWPIAGYAAATLLHAAHNLLASLALPGLLGALYLHLFGGLGLVVLVGFLWEAEKRWIAQRLGAEIAEGRIPARALDALPFLGRPGGMTPRHARELRVALDQLAFHRRQVDEGWAPESAPELEPLRQRVRELAGAAPPQGQGPPVSG